MSESGSIQIRVIPCHTDGVVRTIEVGPTTTIGELVAQLDVDMSRCKVSVTWPDGNTIMVDPKDGSLGQALRDGSDVSITPQKVAGA